MTESIYNSFIEAKNGSILPLLTSGKTLESKYNPENDTLRLLNTYPESSKYFIVFGIGSGILLQTILNKFENCQIIAVEANDETLIFLEQLELIKKLKNNKKIIFTTISSLKNILTTTYVPSFYGNLQIVQQRVWIEENNVFDEVQNIIKASIDEIKADYSVQVHFGKIWQNNIINNLKLKEKFIKETKLEINTDKTVYITAAGPSLEKKLPVLKANRNISYIISTDTTFSTLIKNNIIPDCVVSIDGQHISYSHFFAHNIDFSQILFVLDLCANFSAAQYILENNGKVIFSVNNHPFSSYIKNLYDNDFINLETGTGTVTIAALDFAIKAGFRNVNVLGADFSYTDNKAYAKGTYLDNLYSLNSNKISSSEKAFDKLLFRTELINLSKNKSTTAVLNSYKESFIKYLENFIIKFDYSDEIYSFTNTNKASFPSVITSDFNFESFLKAFNKSDTYKKSFSELTKEDICLLPLISSMRNSDNNNDKPFEELLKMAYTYIEGKA